jgi:hypothetical protein
MTLMLFEISFEKLIRTQQSYTQSLWEIMANFKQMDFTSQPSHDILDCFGQMIQMQHKNSDYFTKLIK